MTLDQNGFAGTPIVVTGGAGYIGSVVAHELSRRGAKVTVIDSLIAGHRDAVGALDFEQLDIREETKVADVLRRTKARAVCHLAAFANIPESFKDPAFCHDVNVAGTRSVTRAMAKAGVRSLVFASTCAIYAPPTLPGSALREGDPEAPASPYATSKRDAEAVIDAAEADGTLQAASLRFFNAAGADRVAGVGERHEPESHLIPRVLRWALDDAAFTVFGTDYPTPDGTCVRDYIHVVDLADAHVRAIARLLAAETAGTKSDARGVFNLGSGVGTSVFELVNRVRAIMKVDREPPTGERRSGDSPFLFAIPTRAKEVLKWEPRHDLDAILADAVWWEKRTR